MSDSCPPTINDLPIHLARAVETICTRFENEWKARSARPIEAYLPEAPERARGALLRELLALEWIYRLQSGELPSRKEYSERFARDIHEISTFFDEIVGASAARDDDPEQTTLHMLTEAASASQQTTELEDPWAATATWQSSERRPKALPTIAGYELFGILGRGAMGVVYHARQSGFERMVALKRIRAGSYATATERMRFLTEAKAAARLRHPNIVTVFAFGDDDDCPYFSQEFVAGGSLSEKIKAGPTTPRRAAELVELLARAMDHAHQQNVVHRDLKPSNVLLTEDGTPKICDFGLARLLDLDGKSPKAGAVEGTASYMAPEQAAGNSAGAEGAADIYSLGAILYELLTGRAPFGPGSFSEVLEQVKTQEPPPPRSLRPELQLDLEAICLKCLQKDPRRRYPSGAALADDLRRWLDGRSTEARPLAWPTRLGRWVRRRPLASATAATVLLAAVLAVPVVRHYRDPERIPKGLLAQLEGNKAVTLIRETGLPDWKQGVIGSPSVELNPVDGTCQVSAFGSGYVELLPKLPEKGYRLKAQLRHDSSTFTGEVGLYFMHALFETGKGTEHCFFLLHFNDRLNEGPESPLSVQVTRYRPGERFPLPSHPRVVATFPPAALEGRSNRPWRDLEEVVSDRGLEIFWDGSPNGAIVAHEVLVELFQQTNSAANPETFEPNVLAPSRPNGGLGIYVDNGSVSVRNVSVEPN
jgi:eukaryotic-like serine/threonine-protein kinase